MRNINAIWLFVSALAGLGVGVASMFAYLLLVPNGEYPKAAVIDVRDSQGRVTEPGGIYQVDLGHRMFITAGLLGNEWIVDTYSERALRHRDVPYHAVLTDDGERIRFYRDLELVGKRFKTNCFGRQCSSRRDGVTKSDEM